MIWSDSVDHIASDFLEAEVFWHFQGYRNGTFGQSELKKLELQTEHFSKRLIKKAIKQRQQSLSSILRYSYAYFRQVAPCGQIPV